MANTKRIYTETLQTRSFVSKTNGVGSEWRPRIEKVYEFYSVDEFLKEFTPIKISQGLIDSITTAFNDFGNVTFNYGYGNKTFYFKK